MRLIDADALNYVRVRIAHDDGTIGGYNAVVPSSEIKNAPTIDAVPVIRCKDCKHWQKSSINYNEYVCYWGGYVKKEDDFCSWAEREEKTNSHGGA